MDIRNPRSLLITGASSGIGAALARAYAADGVRLILTGRDQARLETVAQSCRESGATVEAHLLDVTDRTAMKTWIGDAFAAGPIELVIANAGISGGTGSKDIAGDSAVPSESQEQVGRIFSVNIGGVVNTVFPALNEMQKIPRDGTSPRGQIALMSSLAGFRGLPGAPAYCSSKAAVRSLGEGMRGLYARHGIRVSVICPGFVQSPMTDINPYPMPFMMTAERAAHIIRKGLAHDRARISFPWRLWALVWLMSALPVGLTDPLVARMPEKPAAER
ncbi:MAG: NAD(P)-dependent dehydrogenase (short-subunit alcohol dehydrogenase family) [Alphaproteobacteria bacterium]|jgi:NAD(P)-dependent dehydrogenase (short-subunit alcohol dehydrogenase family)